MNIIERKNEIKKERKEEYKIQMNETKKNGKE